MSGYSEILSPHCCFGMCETYVRAAATMATELILLTLLMT